MDGARLSTTLLKRLAAWRTTDLGRREQPDGHDCDSAGPPGGTQTYAQQGLSRGRGDTEPNTGPVPDAGLTLQGREVPIPAWATASSAVTSFTGEGA